MMIIVKRILVPIDFSETSDAALKYAFGLAQTFSAQLHLLNVQHQTNDTFDPNFPFDQFEKDVWERLETLVSQQEAKQLAHECSVRIGAPADQIVRYADDQHIDLIVMGTHGRSGVEHMLLGSVAEKVVREAPCPVLTLRHS